MSYLLIFYFQAEKSLLESSESSCREQLKQANDTIRMLEKRAQMVDERDRQLLEVQAKMAEKDREFSEIRAKLAEMTQNHSARLDETSEAEG